MSGCLGDPLKLKPVGKGAGVSALHSESGSLPPQIE